MIFLKKKYRAIPSEPQPSPYGKASFLSKITYRWVDPIFKTGYSRPLELNDIYLLEKKYEENNLADKFYKKYNEDFNGNNNPNIVKIFFKIFGRKWIPAGIFLLISDCCNIASPIILELLLNFVSHESTESSYKGWIYTASLLLLQIIATFSSNYYFKIVSEVGLCVKSTIISIIYRKSLRLSQITKQNITDGQIINIVSSDSSRIEELCTYLHSIWSSPLQLFVVLILLIRSLGLWALIGFSILVLFIPLQAVIINWLTSLREQTVGFTDERVKKTQEVISSMRVIKYFSWESKFLTIINQLRSKELSCIKKSLILFAGIDSILDIFPILASSLTFVGYALAGNTLTAAKVFSSLAFFGLLSFPLGDIPFIVSEFADSIVAFKRITKVINSEELTESFTIDPNASYAVSVKNGNFYWEAKKNSEESSDDDDNNNDNNSDNNNDIYDNSSDESNNDTYDEDMENNIININKDRTKNCNKNNGKDEKNEKDEKDNKVFTIKNVNLTIPKNSLTAIIGSVGSGKSSLVNALIGEMKRESGEIIFNGTIGYCPQQAWIQNATIRDNILFGKEYDEEKYRKAIKSCALTSDLKIFPNGDQTEIGERGINLSGGQKQRINLARAVYFDSDIVFLDDPLSAVDAHVSRYLFDHCIMDALRNKTRILVTHQLHILPRVDYIIYIHQGEIIEQGTYEELLERKGEFSKLMFNYGGINENSDKSESEYESVSESEYEKEKDKIENENACEYRIRNKKDKEKMMNLNENDGDDITLLEKCDEAEKEKDDKNKKSSRESIIKENSDQSHLDIFSKEKNELMTEEERYTGSVKFEIYKFYIKAAGGLITIILVLFFLTLSEVTKVGNDLWLTFWTDNKFNLSTLSYVIVYILWGFLQAIAKSLFGIMTVVVSMKAAEKIHSNAISRVIKAPVSFFDTTPLGRIINRFSKDQDSIDNVLPESFQSFISCFAVTISTLVVIIYTTPIFVLPLIPLLLIYYIMQEYYRSTSREIKRIDSLSRSPLYAHINETLNGLSTIRAYSEQKRFIEVNGQLLNDNNRPEILQIYTHRWLSLRLEIIGAFIVFFAAAAGILLKKTISPALLGLSLSYSLNVTGYLNWAVREFSETEIHMNSVERLSHYSKDIEMETQNGKEPPSDWPQHGQIEIKNLTMKYGPHLPPVLHDISLSIHQNEKIGVVGRTGAGKSSIIMSLFRLVEPELGSSIKIDNLSILDMKLSDLRRKLSIIPQDPILFSGTIRFNMDPFNEYSDQEIWFALENSGLKSTISEMEDKLESEVKGNGENFSVGQRQLLCLARAMLRKNRILIMDEATASVDVKTDNIIQKALRSEFKDVTVITIAHRLNTIIDYDKILVLNQGHISEYGSPQQLLYETLEDGSLVPTDKTEFSKLVEETGPVNAELLRKLALSH